MIDFSEKKFSRVFIAFPVPVIQANALSVIHQQNNSLPGIRWTPLPNLHVTLFFLGEVSEENIFPIIESVAKVAKQTMPFNIEFEKIVLTGRKKIQE